MTPDRDPDRDPVREDWVQCPGCPADAPPVPADGPYQGHCPRHWHQGNPQP